MNVVAVLSVVWICWGLIYLSDQHLLVGHICSGRFFWAVASSFCVL